jgi:hypothetical protein
MNVFINHGKFVLFMYVFNFVATFSQILHGFSHKTNNENNKLIRFLQNNHIIINNKKHKNHHTTYDSDFCIVNGWTNPLLNVIYTHILSHFIRANPGHSEDQLEDQGQLEGHLDYEIKNE